MRFVYPNGKRKALTFSYDDGQIFDRKLVKILNEHGMKGTFHLNSGTLQSTRDHEVFISEEEVPELFKGQEVACHGVEHRNPTLITKQQMVTEIWDDRKNLERITGDLVQGMSYAFGLYDQEVEDVIKTLGIKYCRTVNDTCNFFPPADFLQWHPTCHHNNQLSELGKRFLNIPDFYELPLMYVWGHSFEFDRANNWEVIENFAKEMEGIDNIWYATNMEIFRYIDAVRKQEVSADGMKMYNPTAVSIWIVTNEGQKEIKPGETALL